MKIEVIIKPDGTISGDVVEGPGGSVCLKKLDELLSDVGKGGKARKKSEFYQTETQQARKKVNQ